METMGEEVTYRSQGLIAAFGLGRFHQLSSKILTASSAVTLLSII